MDPEIRHLRAAVSVTAKPFFVKMGFRVVTEQRNVVCGVVAPNSIMEKGPADNGPSRGGIQPGTV
jgi:hypothetical protein